MYPWAVTDRTAAVIPAASKVKLPADALPKIALSGVPLFQVAGETPSNQPPPLLVQTPATPPFQVSVAAGTTLPVQSNPTPITTARHDCLIA